jgi:hypothetical protein
MRIILCGLLAERRSFLTTCRDVDQYGLVSPHCSTFTYFDLLGGGGGGGGEERESTACF